MENALTLASWWAIWSLADTYLLSYSPWSEAVVLAACLAARYTPSVVRAVRAAAARGYQKKLVPALERI